MAVKTLEDNGSILRLELDNGDYDKFREAMDKWQFKNEQSLLRFVVSILYLSENKIIATQMDGIKTEVKPAAELLI